MIIRFTSSSSIFGVFMRLVGCVGDLTKVVRLNSLEVAVVFSSRTNESSTLRDSQEKLNYSNKNEIKIKSQK